MKSRLRIAAVLTATFSLYGLADTPPKQLSGFPFQDESLQFSVNWPSGISLGQARMQARRIENNRWEFQFTIDASALGVTITDQYRSVATADLCSVEFRRDSAHGSRKSHEIVTFDQGKNMAHRASAGGGGTSEFPVPACAKDALTFLYFTRVEMGQGRVPLATTISFGGPYRIQLQYTGEEPLKGAVTDRLVCSALGAASNTGFDMLLARDAARTPMLVRAPLTLGTFSLEHMR